MFSPTPGGRPAEAKEPMDADTAAAGGDQRLPLGPVPKVRVDGGAAATSTTPAPPAGNNSVNTWLHTNHPLLDPMLQSNPATPTSTTRDALCQRDMRSIDTNLNLRFCSI